MSYFTYNTNIQMRISQIILDNLTSQAQTSERLRQSMDLRTTSADTSQRILNALEPGTIVPIHRHRNTSETVIIVRGRLIERLYNDSGEMVEEILMEVGGTCPVLQIQAGQWHDIKVLDSGTIIFEAKDGSYETLNDNDILYL